MKALLRSRRFACVCVLLLALLLRARSASAYSVLSHEELVDLLWQKQIQHLLVGRFPALTPAQLNQAHAYAYGGAVIQDLGYYPFGSAFFSNLMHYVRSGDFVMELIRQSQSPDEFACALGALSHYAGDTVGHPDSVNQAVAIAYPKLRARYGKFVTYPEGRVAHLKTEFGFDMEQVALHRYAPQQYHDFIGFQVSKALLQRVFPVVYGLPLATVLPNDNLAIGTFRWSVSRVIPEMTQVALKVHAKDMLREDPTFAKRKFLYRLSRADYVKSWGGDFQRPGWATRLLALLVRLLPKVGPLRALAFNAPTAQTENLYIQSINASVDQYRKFLAAVGTDTLMLPDDDLDDGKLAGRGESTLVDATYSQWLARLAASHYSSTDQALRANLLRFYAGLAADPVAAHDRKARAAALSNLAQLRRQTVLIY